MDPQSTLQISSHTHETYLRHALLVNSKCVKIYCAHLYSISYTSLVTFSWGQKRCTILWNATIWGVTFMSGHSIVKIFQTSFRKKIFKQYGLSICSIFIKIFNYFRKSLNDNLQELRQKFLHIDIKDQELRVITLSTAIVGPCEEILPKILAQ